MFQLSRGTIGSAIFWPSARPAMKPELSDVKARVAAGAAWMIGLRFGMRFIGILSTMVLARLLVPSDFGLVAIASSFVAIIDILGDFGFETYLIRHQDASRDDYDTAWTMNVMRGLVVAAIVVLAAPAAADFFNEPRLPELLFWLAVAAAVFGFQNVGIVEFRKELHFRKEFWFHAAVRSTAVIVTLGIALSVRSYWALIAGMVFSKAFGTVLSYLVHPYRPRFTLSSAGRLLKFSKWLLATSIFQFVCVKMDTFILGRLVGTAPLGLYTLAFEISNFATSELASPMRRALFPGYSKLSASRGNLRGLYLDVFAITVAVCVPLAAGIGLTAEPLVLVLLGNQWAAAVPLLQVLAICGVVRVFGANVNSVFVAMGKPYLNTATIAATLAVGIPAVYLSTSSFGAIGAAWAVTALALFRECLNFSIAYFVLEVPPLAYLERSWRTILSTICMTAVVVTLEPLLPEPHSTATAAASLLVAAASGAVTYLAVHFGSWHLVGRPPGPERSFMSVLEAVRRRFSAAAAARSGNVY